jgi:vesicle-associated membrane protein-associated protein A
MLQALKEEPPLNTKCKDKFLIQSTVITPEKETMTLHDIVCILSPLLQIETL